MPPLLHSLAGGRDLALGSYGLPETLREKEESRPLEPGLFQFLSSCGMPLQTHSLKCMSYPLQHRPGNRHFLKGMMLEVGAANQVRQFGSDPLRHV